MWGSRKGKGSGFILRQVLAKMIDGSDLTIQGFERLRKDEGYAAVLEVSQQEMLSSHRVKRFFKKFMGARYKVYRKVLLELFVWRLNIMKPGIIVLDMDTMVLDNDDAQQREGVSVTYKNKKGYQPIQISWEGKIIDAYFRRGSAHSNHGNDVKTIMKEVPIFCDYYIIDTQPPPTYTCLIRKEICIKQYNYGGIMKRFYLNILFCCILPLLLGGCKPIVTITAPANGATFEAGATITFEGQAIDLQHPDLSDDVFVWTSDKDGEIGTGASFTSSDLSEGDHTITLTVTDPDGQAGQSSITITVGSGGSPTTTTTTASTTGGGDLDTIESIYQNMVNIPAGSFKMGCSDGDTECTEHEKPQHIVKISSSFKMSIYEITQGQWQAVMGSNPSHYNTCGSDCPVEEVSWNAVQAFITTLNSQTGKNYRLPTESEWEYAARAGTTTKYYCGNDESCLGNIAWYDGNSENNTRPVGKKTPNSWGLYDMSGNVWEWVQDYEDIYSRDSVTDPQGPLSGSYLVVRGGGWFYSGYYCRSSNRGSYGPSARNSSMGFRLCLH